mmetsp:Transcript_32275/g.63058  ORF Transcript_32275/g.63058 Transcript_32275/m.63058 type:complete len:223 (-) Transcript_32275:108-776(-)
MSRHGLWRTFVGLGQPPVGRHIAALLGVYPTPPPWHLGPPHAPDRHDARERVKVRVAHRWVLCFDRLELVHRALQAGVCAVRELLAEADGALAGAPRLGGAVEGSAAVPREADQRRCQVPVGVHQGQQVVPQRLLLGSGRPLRLLAARGRRRGGREEEGEGGEQASPVAGGGGLGGERAGCGGVYGAGWGLPLFPGRDLQREGCGGRPGSEERRRGGEGIGQ